MIGSVVFKALFLRPLRRGPWRFLSTVVGVAAGVAAVVSTLAASRAALASLVEGVAEVSGVAAWELAMPGGMSEEEAARQAAAADLAVVAPVVEELVVLEGLDDAVRLLGVDPLVDRHVRALRVEGGDEAQRQEYWTAFQGLLAADGVCLPDPLARRLGLEVGGGTDTRDADGVFAAEESINEEPPRAALGEVAFPFDEVHAALRRVAERVEESAGGGELLRREIACDECGVEGRGGL